MKAYTSVIDLTVWSCKHTNSLVIHTYIYITKIGKRWSYKAHSSLVELIDTYNFELGWTDRYIQLNMKKSIDFFSSSNSLPCSLLPHPLSPHMSDATASTTVAPISIHQVVTIQLNKSNFLLMACSTPSVSVEIEASGIPWWIMATCRTLLLLPP
jgi:hypothetical protein